MNFIFRVMNDLFIAPRLQNIVFRPNTGAYIIKFVPFLIRITYDLCAIAEVSKHYSIKIFPRSVWLMRSFRTQQMDYNLVVCLHLTKSDRKMYGL